MLDVSWSTHPHSPKTVPKAPSLGMSPPRILCSPCFSPSSSSTGAIIYSVFQTGAWESASTVVSALPWNPFLNLCIFSQTCLTSMASLCHHLRSTAITLLWSVVIASSPQLPAWACPLCPSSLKRSKLGFLTMPDTQGSSR